MLEGGYDKGKINGGKGDCAPLQDQGFSIGSLHAQERVIIFFFHENSFLVLESRLAFVHSGSSCLITTGLLRKRSRKVKERLATMLNA